MIALKKKKTLTRTKKSEDKEKMCLLILNLCLLELLKKKCHEHFILYEILNE